mmetsp:Transcript_109525/g.327434  ORF Transcript_109525/g.327434 Transcript_109525/m.327434 type:complete len:175 (+) Transcript_109525:624-1148(+)
MARIQPPPMALSSVKELFLPAAAKAAAPGDGEEAEEAGGFFKSSSVFAFWAWPATGGCVGGPFGGGPPAVPGGLAPADTEGLPASADVAQDAARGPAAVVAVTREAGLPQLVPEPLREAVAVTVGGACGEGPPGLTLGCDFLQPMVEAPDLAVQAGVGWAGTLLSFAPPRPGSK